MFTGGCHYSLSCEKYTSDCLRCPLLPFPIKYIPKKNLKKTQHLFNTYANQINVIAPSNWIGKTALKSSILKKVKVSQIGNTHIGLRYDEKYVDKNSFINYENLLKIGIASVDKKSPLKNGNLLPELEELIDFNKIPVKIIYLADCKKTDSYSNTFWKTIDYLLVISKIDNSPNVIHEAKLFGIPIIGTNVGGITELLNFEYDFLIDSSQNILNQTIDVFKSILIKKPVHKPDKIISDYNKNSFGNLQMVINLYKSTLGVL